MHLPADFTRTVAAIFGDTGADWLARLPALLDACVARWELTLGAPFALAHNYVAPATRGWQRGGAEAALLTIERRVGRAAALQRAWMRAVAR
jgi:streptomycin 6-kinase